MLNHSVIVQIPTVNFILKQRERIETKNKVHNV